MRLASCCLLLLTGTAAAQSTAELARTRVRGGVWAGPALLRGALRLEAPSARVDTRIDAVPAVAVGADLWPEEALGIYFGAAIGTGAELSLPVGEAKLRYNAQLAELGARYRWHLGPARDATAVFLALGGRLLRQDVQTQQPSILVDSVVIGPELAAGGELAVLSGRIWLRGTARAGLPFYIRETPEDSGDPREFLGFGGRAELVVRLFGDWGAEVLADYGESRVQFEGEGTRAAGVEDARTHDRFFTFMLLARHTL